MFNKKELLTISELESEIENLQSELHQLKMQLHKYEIKLSLENCRSKLNDTKVSCLKKLAMVA